MNDWTVEFRELLWKTNDKIDDRIDGTLDVDQAGATRFGRRRNIRPQEWIAKCSVILNVNDE
jgi:hypothetical protein